MSYLKQYLKKDLKCVTKFIISRTWKPILENLRSFKIVYYNTTRHVNDNISLYIQYRCAYKPGIELYFYLIQKTSAYYQQINRALEIRNWTKCLDFPIWSVSNCEIKNTVVSCSLSESVWLFSIQFFWH